MCIYRGLDGIKRLMSIQSKVFVIMSLKQVWGTINRDNCVPLLF